MQKNKLAVLVGLVVVGGAAGTSYAQLATMPQSEPTFSASPVKTVPKVSTFGVPIGDATQERLNEPIAVQRVRCGQEDACFRGNEPESEIAQDDLVESRPVDPRTVDDGLYGSLSLGYTHHDNIERIGDEGREDSGLGIGLGLLYRGRYDRLSYQLGAQTSAVAYDDNDSNDFDNLGLTAGLLYELTEIVDIGIHAGLSKAKEERNTSGSRLVEFGREADDVETKIVGAQVTVGRAQSRMQFVLAASRSENNFTLNDADDIAAGVQDFRDRKYDHLSGTVFYNTQGPMRYFFEANYTQIDYQNDFIRDLDSDETGYYVGALWAISAITSAEAKVGKLNKDFDNPVVEDYDELSYAAKIRWQPTHRAAFTLYGTKRTEETTVATANFFESNVLGVNFAYQLLPQKLDLVAYYNKIDDDFNDGREDETDDYGIGLTYHPRRWLGVGVRYGKSNRDSNVADANFEDDYFDLFLQLNAGKSIKLF